MFLSTNSNICASSGLVSINLSITYLSIYLPIYFPFVVGGRACLVVFERMTGIMNFTLLSAEYFCIPINSFGFCSGTQLSYLAAVWFFWSCFSDLLDRTGAMLSVGLIIPHYWVKTPFCTFSGDLCEAWDFPVSLVEIGDTLDLGK